MKKCHKGWHTGECCCNCIHQLKLMCHPCNKEIGKGSISTQMGYICKVQFGDGSNKGTSIFFQNGHGYCEFHQEKKTSINLNISFIKKILKEAYTNGFEDALYDYNLKNYIDIDE